MKKKLIIFHILYYVLTLLIYIAFFSADSLLFKLSGEADNLGAAIAVTYGLLFVMTPVITAVLMRFSLFRWYIDPFAAAEVPLFLYLGMIRTQFRRSGALKAAFLLVNRQLADDGGMGWLFLIGLFIFGLLMSLSFARKNGQSISYRILSKITKTEAEGASK